MQKDEEESNAAKANPEPIAVEKESPLTAPQEAVKQTEENVALRYEVRIRKRIAS